MAKPVNRGPNQALRGDVAQPKDLRDMSKPERKAHTCKVCRITYRHASSVGKCQRWHEGRT